MAAKKTARAGVSRAKNPNSDKQCKDCARSYDWHSRALDGHLILCRCQFRMQGGKFCIFLTDEACPDNFIPRKEAGDLYGKEHHD